MIRGKNENDKDLTCLNYSVKAPFGSVKLNGNTFGFHLYHF